MKYGLIGNPLTHSLSVEIHSAIGEEIGAYPYVLCPLAEEELDGFFAEKDFDAVNVTIPYKKAVMKYLDIISPEAKEIGCVNTVLNRCGKLYGYNTDVFGMEEMLKRASDGYIPKKVAVLGTGGTSLTAVYVSGKLWKDAEIFRVSRSPKGNDVGYASIPGDTDAVINCTPVGMYPHAGVSPIDVSRFPHLRFVCDAVYNPRRTKLILDAEKRGIRAENGLRMLVTQAIYAASLFFDREIDGSAIYEKIRKSTENVVLIGMPSCGKTAVGKAVADVLGRPFYDTDGVIYEKTGRTPAEIITSDGEDVFRRIESEVVSSLTEKADGRVISTGGGAILDPSNVENLKKNGRVFYLKKELTDLIPSPDRPLTSDCGKLKRIFEERCPIYESSADTILTSDCENAIIGEYK